MCFENKGLDFEVDLTDLETFGETAPIKTPKMQEMPKAQDVCVKSKKAASPPPSSETEKVGEILVNTSGSSQEEMNISLPDTDDVRTEERSQPTASDAAVPKAEQSRLDLASTGDSDDEKLVIADSVSPAATPTKQPKLCSANSEPSTPEKVTRQRRQSKRAKVSGDQLSEILRMQKAMFSSANDAAKCSFVSQEASSSNRCVGPSTQSHPTSLVKPCVSSYLERNQSWAGETCTAPQETSPAVNPANTRHKSKWIGFFILGIQFVFIPLINIMHPTPPPTLQKFCQKTYKLVQKMNKIMKLRRKATCSTSCTVCRMCCSWCAALSL